MTSLNAAGLEAAALAIYRRRHSGDPNWPVGLNKDGYHQEPYVNSVPDWKWRGYEEDARAVLRALASPVDRHEVVGVKALEWNPFRAETPFGYYHIDDQTDRPADELKGRLPFLLSGSRIDLSRHSSLADARAAAQADFDTRIRSALRPSDSPALEEGVAVTEAMVETFQAKYREIGERCNWSHSWPAAECVREMLTAALAIPCKGAGEMSEAAELIAALRAATMGFDWSDLPDDTLIPAVPLLRKAADRIETLEARVATLSAALEPFGREASEDDGSPREDWAFAPDNELISEKLCDLTYGHFRAAREATR